MALNADATTRRFVILRHRVGEGLDRTDHDHLDWMFQRADDVLQVWETPLVEVLEESFELPASRLNDHRIKYLDYEGPIRGDRGDVQRIVSGMYRVARDGEDAMLLSITWRDGDTLRHGEVSLQRMRLEDPSRRDDNCDGWRLRFSPCR